MSHRPTSEVIVVDDDDDVCEALATLIEADGYASAIFTTARDALGYLHELASPRLILVDATMPDVDGWEFLTELGRIARLEKVPAFLMSADTRLDAERARDLGASGVLRKPFDLPMLSDLDPSPLQRR